MPRHHHIRSRRGRCQRAALASALLRSSSGADGTTAGTGQTQADSSWSAAGLGRPATGPGDVGARGRSGRDDDTMVSATAGVADHRRAPWAPILLRVGLLLAVLGLLAAVGQLLGPRSPERLRRLLAALGPFAPVAFGGACVQLLLGRRLTGSASGLTRTVTSGYLPG
jgi:hypothetical protein